MLGPVLREELSKRNFKVNLYKKQVGWACSNFFNGKDGTIQKRILELHSFYPDVKLLSMLSRDTHLPM